MERMKSIPVAFAFACSMALLPGCSKNNINNGAPSISVINGSVAGTVTDLNKIPVSNATVTAGAVTATTDGDGHFIIRNAQLNKDGGFVEVTKPGFFAGSRTFIVSSDAVNNVKIQLIPKTVSGKFQASSAASINVPGGSTVNFTANSTVTASNNSDYAGEVSVSGFYLNPADVNFSEYMPGDLQGLDLNNQQTKLKSFGMILIEMNDAVGGKLQIANGKTATISIPIPTLMQAGAPASIPLWYFSDSSGTWKQQGSATKQGDNYVGAVSHFSFWTAAQLEQGIKLTATFKDSTGASFANKLITVSSGDSTDYETSNGYTDSAGTVRGFVPANKQLVLKLYNQNAVIYSEAIGPFSSDIDLGVITLTPNPTLTLYGTVEDCDNNALANGTVNIFVDNTQWSADVTNGNFSITFNRYNNLTQTATIVAENKNTFQWGLPKVVTISGNNQDIGQIVACAPVASDSEYINLNINGTNYSWASPDHLGALLAGAGQTTVEGSSVNFINLYFNNYNGTYPGGEFEISISATINNITYSTPTGSNNRSTTTITSDYANVGDYVTGTASGQVTGSDPNTPLPFSLNFKVKRIQ